VPRRGNRRRIRANKKPPSISPEGFLGHNQIGLGDLFSRPAPAEQAQCAEADDEERECSGNMSNFRYCEWEHLQDC